jgi:orotate phosphoribosyltransferase
MQADAISPGQTVVVIDDVIATGAYYLNFNKYNTTGC